MSTTTTTIDEAVDRYRNELAAAIDAGTFSPQMRERVERILGWNAEKAHNIPAVFAERLTQAADFIAGR